LHNLQYDEGGNHMAETETETSISNNNNQIWIYNLQLKLYTVVTVWTIGTRSLS
jgi:hypothetical protein